MTDLGNWVLSEAAKEIDRMPKNRARPRKAGASSMIADSCTLYLTMRCKCEGCGSIIATKEIVG